MFPGPVHHYIHLPPELVRIGQSKIRTIIGIEKVAVLLVIGEFLMVAYRETPGLVHVHGIVGHMYDGDVVESQMNETAPPHAGMEVTILPTPTREPFILASHGQIVRLPA